MNNFVELDPTTCTNPNCTTAKPYQTIGLLTDVTPSLNSNPAAAQIYAGYTCGSPVCTEAILALARANARPTK